MSTSNATVLVAGTEIGVDFGPTAPTNSFNNANAGSAAAKINVVFRYALVWYR